jgi:hypothetical protein
MGVLPTVAVTSGKITGDVSAQREVMNAKRAASLDGAKPAGERGRQISRYFLSSR